jgi:inorganic pyrophosphatase
MNNLHLRFKSHPWHGVNIGEKAPEILTVYIEVVPLDTIKYEVDKASGYLKIDRPQKYSNVIPVPYGFVPQTFCGDRLAAIANEKTLRDDIVGDGDPLDICVLTEKSIPHGDILAIVKPIGGIRMIDGGEADDKIIAVLKDDMVYSEYNDISELPIGIITRLRHYFLTYKDIPEQTRNTSIAGVYGHADAMEVIRATMEDYKDYFKKLKK